MHYLDQKFCRPNSLAQAYSLLSSRHMLNWSGAFSPLTGGGKCLLEKLGESKKLKTGGIFFSVANCLEMHGTEYNNFVYNSSIFFCSLRSQITCSPIHSRLYLKGRTKELASLTPAGIFFKVNVTTLRTTVPKNLALFARRLFAVSYTHLTLPTNREV